MRATALRRSRRAAPVVATDCVAQSERGAIDYGPLERRLGYVLRRAQIAVFRDFFSSFEAFDIRPGQYSILTIIECNPGLRQSEVSGALGIKRANLVAMIDELERRKLVRRDSAPNDRRSHALVLTEEGKRLMRELHVAAERHERRIAEKLGPETHRRMFAKLKRLARMGDGDEG
ncbi:MAG TPA: MarR family transcriptional regulator [Roseiarcus sp.]|nr:MarR family transcriptional regulator [Roseiarcus sp.]